MADFVIDNLSAANGTVLTARSGELGASWTRHPSVLGQLTAHNTRMYGSTTGLVYASGVPVDADYDVTVDMLYLSNTAANGIAGRIQPTINSAYYCYHNLNEWVLAKVVNGGVTGMGVYAQTLSASTTYALKLEMRGTAIKVYVNDVLRISATDSSISAAGHAGFRIVTAGTTTTAKHFSNFKGTDTSIYVPPDPPATGEFFSAFYSG